MSKWNFMAMGQVGLLNVGNVRADFIGHPGMEPGQDQQRAGQLLSDLVMQLLSDPQALGLLSGEHPAGCLAALGLEAIEHLVERLGELARLGVRIRCGHPLAGIREVDSAR